MEETTNKKSRIVPYFILMILIILADQITKAVVFGNLSSEKTIIENLFSISPTVNNGVSFGLFADKSWARPVFISVSAVAIAVFFMVFILSLKGNFFLKTSLVLIISGAAGNFIDRIIIGGVRDFISVHFFPAIFNVADSALVVGCVVLVFYFLFIDKNAVFKSKKKASSVNN